MKKFMFTAAALLLASAAHAEMLDLVCKPYPGEPGRSEYLIVKPEQKVVELAFDPMGDYRPLRIKA
jgi:hypothetical protein